MTTAKLLGLGVLAAGLAALGCDKPADPPKAEAKRAAAKGEHDHGAGPHGGTVMEFGKYHAEFCVDHAKKQATVYILDGKVKSPVPIAADKLLLSIKEPRFQADLVAAPQDGDPAGKASRFVATHDALGKEQEFEGTVGGKVDGTPYLGDFKEEPDHDHKPGGK
ncbi:MAG: hypothetical protein K2X87_21225 [Gemmataceae bacterium]|nr:hypothetical protein [Gemmataceae bacterium]